MRVIILPEVLDYLEELVEVLYKKGYFSYENSSLSYVVELYDEIIADLLSKLHKNAPQYFDKYGKGMKYAGFRKNKRTMWYVFFKIYRQNGENVYLIRYISNNHVVAQYL